MPKEEARSSAVTPPARTAHILANILMIGSSPTITELWNLMRINFLIEVSAPSHSSHPGFNIKVQGDEEFPMTRVLTPEFADLPQLQLPNI